MVNTEKQSWKTKFLKDSAIGFLGLMFVGAFFLLPLVWFVSVFVFQADFSDRTVAIVIVACILVLPLLWLPFLVQEYISESAWQPQRSEAMSDESLFDAIMSGNEELAVQWVKAGKPLEVALQTASSALQLAISNNMYSLADALIDAGIELNSQDRYGVTTLHTLIVNLDPLAPSHALASQGGHSPSEIERLIARLVDEGVDLSLRRTEDECTQLMLAASYGQRAVVSLLIDAGADVNATSSGGSALNRAAFEGVTDVVRLLIQRGANVNDTDQSGQTPLLHASLHGHLDCVEALLAAGADPNLQSKSGFTGLMHACYKGHLDIVRTLIEHGADLSLRDKDGNGPVQYAEGGGALHIIPLLSK